MPPAELMSAMACSTPFLSCAPNVALPPVMGPATPNLICAEAPSTEARPRPKAKPEASPRASHCLIGSFLGCKTTVEARFKPQTREKSSGFYRVAAGRLVAAAPAQQSFSLIDPIVASHHLVYAHQAES